MTNILEISAAPETHTHFNCYSVWGRGGPSTIPVTTVLLYNPLVEGARVELEPPFMASEDDSFVSVCINITGTVSRNITVFLSTQDNTAICEFVFLFQLLKT